MKKVFLLLFCVAIVFYCSAQKTRITTTTLPNGMSVVLCEDHEQPKIMGAVCVHAGAKNDPEDNTGMAHYLEHLMFKGTDQIGTTDWEKESPILKNISDLYDDLHVTTDEKKRDHILKQINNLSNEACKYAIPNEVDVILSKMGGEDVNAFTSNDVTVYLNSFPSNQLEKWLQVYAERFRHPVFRLFQSELEAVYEEYNMYQDQPMSVFLEDALAAAYGKHPYGRPVIGYSQHLKNPQISAMQGFFDKYYRPSNMTLILVGDFKSEATVKVIEKYFDVLSNENDISSSKFSATNMKTKMHTDLGLPLEPFKGHQIITVKETPVNMGLIGFQTIGAQEKESFLLDLLGNLLCNEEETGLLDKLVKENKILTAQAFPYSMKEHGLFAFFYVPKILGQTHEDAEQLIFKVIEDIKNGKFSDDLFNATKTNFLKDHILSTENYNDLFYSILEMVSNNQDPNLYFKREETISKLTKEDLMKMAQRFFGKDCLLFRSEIGQKQAGKLQKPDWKPIIAQNTGASSDFANNIVKTSVSPIKAQNVDFESSVKEIPLNGMTMYCSKNPRNDYFDLEIVHHYGTITNPLLSVAADYFNKQGSKDNSFEKIQMQLQRMGASFYVSANEENFFIHISGFDKNLPEILSICQEKLFSPSNDESALKTIIDHQESSMKITKNDASAWGRALYYYALYGQNSPFLTRPTLKTLKGIQGKTLLSIIEQAQNTDGYITYVGNNDPNELANLLKKALKIDEKQLTGKTPVLTLQAYKQPTVFVASNSQFLQSNIYFYIMGNTLKDEFQRTNCLMYNEYMGGSMAGIIFQEIRELRSLGYSAYAAYNYDRLNRRPGYLMGYLGTQADKTIEGCEAMSDLLVKFPDKSDKFELAKTSAISKMEADYISFRQLPARVQKWREQDYKSDPREKQLSILKEMSYEDLIKFYKESIGKQPLVITIAGDKKRINLKSLSKDYKVIELKYKDIFKE